MEIAETYSYRHAEAILENVFDSERQEIVDAIHSVDWVPKSRPVTRTRNGRVVANLTLDQRATNFAFDTQFETRGWTKHPLIVSNAPSQLAADFKKGPVQVEVQFGNMARWYTDGFKFLLSYAADDIDVGVLIVPVLQVARRIDENVANYERVVRELPHAKMAVTIPVWVIGVGN